MLQYLRALAPTALPELTALEARLAALPKATVRKDDLTRLEAAEHLEAQGGGREKSKFASDDEMLAAMNLAGAVVPAH